MKVTLQTAQTIPTLCSYFGILNLQQLVNQSVLTNYYKQFIGSWFPSRWACKYISVTIFWGNQPCSCSIKNQCSRDLLRLHHQGRCGEWQYVANIYSSLSNRWLILLAYYAVGGWSHPPASRLVSLCQLISILCSMLFLVFVFLGFSWYISDERRNNSAAGIPCFAQSEPFLFVRTWLYCYSLFGKSVHVAWRFE